MHEARKIKMFFISKIVVVLFLLFLSINSIYANGIPPIIEHYPVEEVTEGMPFTISATVLDEDDIKNVNVYFRTVQQQSYQVVQMIPSGGAYSAQIDGMYVVVPYLEYYIEATDKAGNKNFSPKTNYLTRPHFVKIRGLSKVEQMKPSGNWTVFYRKATGDYSPLQPIPPGSVLNFNLNATAQSNRKSYLLWANRETEQYSERTQNRFKFEIRKKDITYTIGDFYANFSDLSFPGVEIRRGLSAKSNLPRNNFHLIGGHSQIDVEEKKDKYGNIKLSPAYRQYFLGIRQELSLSKKTNLALNITHNKDDSNSISTGSGLLATKDTTGSIELKYSLLQNVNLSGEYAKNRHSLSDGTKSDDDAYQVKLETATEKLNMLLSYKNIGSNFFTTGTLSGITTTNKKGSMDNNKKGIWTTFEYKPLKLFALSGGFDDYKEVSPSGNNTYIVKTQDKKVGISLTPKKIPSVALRIGELERKRDNGTVESTSKSLSYGTGWSIPDLGPLNNVRMTYNRNEIKYTSTAANLKIGIDAISMEGAYKNLLVLSSNLNKTNTKDLKDVTTTKKDNLSIGLNWNVIPYKLTTQLSWQNIKDTKSDGSIDKNEENYTLQANYYLNDKTILSCIGKDIKYEDKKDRTNNYDEKIITLKLTRTFFEIKPKQKIKIAKEKEITKVEEIKPVEKIAKVEEVKPVVTEPKEEIITKPQEKQVLPDEKKMEIPKEQIKVKPEPVIQQKVETQPVIVPRKIKERKKKYIMKAGETFQQVARRIYGDERKYLQIIINNPHVYKYAHILPGQKVSFTTPQGKKITYVVKSGDTLFRIAKRFFGEGELFVEIARQNPQINIYVKKDHVINILED